MRPAAPVRVLRALAGRLGQHGLTRLYGAADAGLGVLSLPQVTVWCYGHTLTWTCDGQATTMPASDITIAATFLAALAARPSPGCPQGPSARPAVRPDMAPPGAEDPLP